jgi:putative ABC transport system permease protein
VIGKDFGGKCSFIPSANGACTPVSPTVLKMAGGEAIAKKIFRKRISNGKNLTDYRRCFPATVTGIMKDIPENSHIKGDLVLSMSTITKKWNTDLDNQWRNYGVKACILLKPGVKTSSGD